MKKSRFSETQIVAILKTGRCRKAGQGAVPGAWHFGGDLLQLEIEVRWHGASDLKRMKELKAENAKLKRMYADLALENRAMRGISLKKSCERA